MVTPTNRYPVFQQSRQRFQSMVAKGKRPTTTYLRGAKAPYLLPTDTVTMSNSDDYVKDMDARREPPEIPFATKDRVKAALPKRQAPKSLADALRMQLEPPSSDAFLPVATSRPDPPEEEDVEYEYRPVFEAPERIDLLSSEYADEDRSAVSELTHEGVKGRRWTSNGHDGEHIHLDNVVEEGGNETAPVDVTDLTDMDAVYAVHDETMDEVLVLGEHPGGSDGHKESKCDDRHPVDCEDAGRLTSEPPASRGKTSTQLNSLIKETLSAEGELIVDTTDIKDDDLDTREVQETKETPSAKGKFVVNTTDIKDDDLDTREVQETVGSMHSHDSIERELEIQRLQKLRRKLVKRSKRRQPSPEKRRSPKSQNKGRSQQRGKRRTPGSPKKCEEAKESRRHTSDIVNPETRDTPANEDLKGMLNYSLAYLHMAADDIKASFESQLEKLKQIEIVTEADVGGMLGVLDEGIKETSERAPTDDDEFIMILGKQIEETATCGIDGSTGVHGQPLPVVPLEAFLGKMKKSYQACAGIGPGKTESEAPRPMQQTYIVPMSLRASVGEVEVEGGATNSIAK